MREKVTLALQIASVRHARNMPDIKSNSGLVEALEQAERSLEFIRRNSSLIKGLFVIEQRTPFLADFLEAWPELKITVERKAIEEGLTAAEVDDGE